MSSSLDTARQLLRTQFGYPDFRSGQDEIIRSVLDGRDTVAVMPTGGGKSLCYQIPALLFEGLTIVVSPLISLMKDQVDALQRASVRATFINSMLEYRDALERIEKARHGWYKLMYVAPERFESTSFLDRIKGIRIGLFAIDEAHCISEWGHDFRPSYMKLRQARAFLGDPQVVALTATATPDVRIDIQRQLGLTDPAVIVRGFKRENLSLRVIKGGRKRDAIFSACASGDCGIVYGGTRNTVEEIADFLKQHAVSAEAYHAGLDDRQRKAVQERFMSGDVRVIVATTAFGMGIDKPDVRFVIHHDMPGTIEQYYQEAGRAGRDGGESACIVLFTESDRSLPEYFIRQSFPDKATVQSVYSALHNAVDNSLGQTYRGLVNLTPGAIAAQLGKTSEAAARSSLDLLERHGYIRRISAAYPRSTVQFLLPPEQLREWLIESASETLSPVMVALMRTAGGEAFYHPVDVEIDRIAEKSFLAEEHILSGLRSLHDLKIIEFHSGQRLGGIALTGTRIQARDLEIDFRQVQARMAHQVEKLQAMERYILGRACRQNMILEYFEETDIQGVCGKCDNCSSTTIALPLPDENDSFEEYYPVILHCIAELGGKFGRTVIADTLRGAKTRRITQYRLNEASTYGKTSRADKRELFRAIDAMTGLGWLEKTRSMYPALHLTATGRKRLGVQVAPLALPGPGGDGVDDPVLYEALRAARRRIAGELNIPSHTLAPDALLRRIANALPEDEDAMLALEGMGPAMFRKCGRIFLGTIGEHRRQLELAAAMEESRGSIESMSPSLKATFELCARGLSLAEIAQRRGQTEGVVSRHISELIERGAALNLDSYVIGDHQAQIRKTLARMKKPDLKKIKAMVDEEISWAEIRIMLAVTAREKLRR
jgi:ATP-dependent DNA helicase RecQ